MVHRPVGPSRVYDVRAACAWVATVAAHVRIDDDALGALAEALSGEAASAPAWGAPHLVVADASAEAVAGWTLLLSALNFSFWQDEPRWRVSGFDGYMAMAHALRRGWDAGVPLAEPAHWVRWSVADLAAVLRGDP